MEKLRKEFEDTALEHMGAIYSAALRMSKDKSEAEDLVQDTYLRAYRFFDRFEPGTSIKAWLFRILKNTYINNFKKRSKTPEHIDFDRLRLSEEEPTSSHNPEEEVLYSTFGDELMRSIEALPEEFQKVIMLSDVYGYSYKETAKELGRPIGTVMSRLHRGRKLLRISLYEQAKELGYAIEG
ncbi:sigma-70 family RNA polymerase sigma factor [Candidatus Poribacteria bacterium]|nr:sigma-70 family RNA polymerase sigma factor [Candidatus Poribacteria bacterium]